MTIPTPVGRRFYRLRAPQDSQAPVAVSVRVDPTDNQLYLAVGSGRRRMYLTESEAWTLWRCLSEAVGSLGEPPQCIRTNVAITGRRAA